MTSTAIIAVNPFAPLGALARAVQRKLHPTRLAAKVGIAAARDLTTYGQVWCKSICGSGVGPAVLRLFCSGTVDKLHPVDHVGQMFEAA